MNTRKIKYRAFSQKYKELIPVKYIDEDGIPIDENGEEIEEPILFESIGVLDRNGDEIYNGDTINVFDSRGFMVYQNKSIFYSSRQGKYCVLLIGGIDDLLESNCTFKIIGHVSES